MNKIKFVLGRFGQASTYAGLAAACGTISANAPPEYALLLWLATAAFTGLAVILK